MKNIIAATATATTKTTMAALVIAVMATASLLLATWIFPVITSVNAQQISTNATTAAPATPTPMGTTFTVQKTATSVQDSLPGHETHQAAVVLPKRDDGKIWVGTITWSASKPVEFRILQDYNSSIAVDEAHGKPVTAPFGGGEAAISLILPQQAATIPSFNAGSMNFAGSQAAFHTLGGGKFTVTYTIDAMAKDKTQ